MRSLLDQGVDLAPEALRKRVRLVNVLSVFGAFLLFASIPFDWVTAPRWMLAEDVFGALLYASFPLLNRRGWFTLTRILCITVTNVIVLGNAILLGPESGAQMVFFALAAMPFAMFDLRERRPLVALVGLAIACFAVAESGLFADLQSVSENYSPTSYYVYSSVMTLLILLFTVVQTSAANVRAERLLRESREHYRLVTEAAGDAILTTRDTDRIVFASPAAVVMFGHSLDELHRLDLSNLIEDIHPAPGTSVRSLARRKDGTTFPVEISIGESKDDDTPIRTAVVRDVSDRVRAEAELDASRQSALLSAKMAALGVMSGGIAHEVNNPLAAILLRAQQLRRLATREQLDAEAVVASARQIETTVGRIKKVVDALRTFARDSGRDPLEPTSVARLVDDAVELCSERFRQAGIVLQVGTMASDLAVACRETQISQILLNLLDNAHDAVEGLPERWIRIEAEADLETVRLCVTDSGEGIPSEIQPRIMEPFFTTKAFGKGTGLGLSVSRGLAESHGGQLVHDAKAPHTRFVLTLQRVPPPIEASASGS